MKSSASLGSFLGKDLRRRRDDKYFVLASTEEVAPPACRHRLLLDSDGSEVAFGAGALVLDQSSAVSSGVFRNSFFYPIFQQCTSVRRLAVAVSGFGKISLNVMHSAPNSAPTPIASRNISLLEGEPEFLKLPDLDTYPPNGRLYWEVKSRSPRSEITRLDFVTDDVSLREPRLVVLIRTFGRTADVIRLLRNFSDQRNTAEHNDFIAQTKFVVLDTSPRALPAYDGLIHDESLNLLVMDGSNLGGGGNAAQVLYRVLESGNDDVDEIVLMDDDLEITLESLCRYRAFTRFRSSDVITTCPVLMKSEPSVVWEDGGYWGRFHPTRMTPSRSSLFPRLLKHGWRVGEHANKYLDEFGRLTFPEYATFIFFAASVSTFRKLGFPAAFFLRGDDIEFSLRAGKAGIKMVSNPNLCAWHEPAHSYGQEYMAILHGIIINFKYGASDKGSLAKFFDGRFQAHSSYRDGLGLSVYVKVLERLIGGSPILERHFEQTYISDLAELKKLEATYERVGQGIVDDLVKSGHVKAKVVPFVHMPANGTDEIDTVVLQNHPHKTFSFRDPHDAEQNLFFYSVAKRFCELYPVFLDQYDNIVAEYTRRLGVTATKEFWDPLFANVPYETKASTARPSAPKKRPVLEQNQPNQRSKPKSDRAFPFSRRQSAVDESHLLPDDFDDATYLRLNPDVSAAAMPARTHFLKHGRHEGRAWKIERE